MNADLTAAVGEALTRIESTKEANPAWIHVIPLQRLFARTAELETARKRGDTLPLYGMTFGVKDNIDVAGCPTTAACPAFEYVPEESAYAVQKLEAAGALCLGKTNMDQFATGLVGTRSPYGICVNPFDARYISGGSSSGSAVAVALGHVTFALGTDTAGSGRVPAAFCGITGLKPTRGLVSTRGVVPACRSLDCLSIFASKVDDATRVFEVMRGFDPEDPYSRDAAPREAAAEKPARVGVPWELEFFGDRQAEHTFRNSLQRIQARGAKIVHIDYTPFRETAALLYSGPWVAERLAAIEPFLREHADEMHPVVREIIAGGARFSAADTFNAQYELETLKKKAALEWEKMDVMVVPTAPTIYTIEQVLAEPIKLNTQLGYYTNFVNLLDLCALSVPAGAREDRLPCGITLIAPALEDAALARYADWFTRPLSARAA